MMTKERQLVEYEIEVRKMASDGRELLYKESDKLNDEIKEKICLLNNLHGRLQFMNLYKNKLGVEKAEANAKHIYLDAKDISNEIKAYIGKVLK